MKTIIKNLINQIEWEIEKLKSVLPMPIPLIPDINLSMEITWGIEKLNLLNKIGNFLELNKIESKNNPFYYWDELRSFIQHHCKKWPSDDDWAFDYRIMVTVANCDDYGINEAVKARNKLVAFLKKLLEVNLNEQKGNKDIWLIIKK